MNQDKFLIKKADILTEEWLNGIQQGWLSLFNPTINNWSDVYNAINALKNFIRNLYEQITFVRPIPTKIDTIRRPKNSLPSKDDWVLNLLKYEQDQKNKKIDDNFYEVLSQIDRFVYEVKKMNFIASLIKDYDNNDDLEMYKNDFVGTLSRQLIGRYKRLSSVTKLLDSLLKKLKSEAKEIKKIEKEDPEKVAEEFEGAFKEFNIGEMKVVITASDFHGGLVNKYIPFIQEAKALLENKGFSEAWRDKMFIQSDEFYTYIDPKTKEKRSRAGVYFAEQDYIVITSAPKERLVKTIVHEIGHRYWYKYMTQEQRGRFESFIDLKKSENDENQFTVMPVSAYGRTKIEEAFSEVFAYYVCEKDMTRDQVDSFKAVLKKAEDRIDEIVKMATIFYSYLI